jgi:hypothetical protein
MNGYEKAVALNLAGTDAEIVAILKTLTVGDIPCSEVRTWMREHLIWYRGDGQMGGSLATAKANASPEQQGNLDYLYATVWGDSAQMLRTTDPFWAPQVAQLVELVATLVPEAATLVDEFYALDGGRPYLTLTEVEFAAQRVVAVEAESIQAVIDTASQTLRDATAASAVVMDAAITTAQEAHAPVSGKENAILGWIDVRDKTDETPESLQAYVDILMATEDGNPPVEEPA